MIDEIKADDIGANLVGVGELSPDKEWQIIRKNDEIFWQEDNIVPEQEMNLEQCETEKREQTN